MVENEIITIKDFETIVVNAPEIINENNLTDDNIKEFLTDKVSYFIDKTCHKVKLIKNLRVENEYTPIDANLVNVIVHLNENGYYTDWCCEGSDKNDGGYISFTNGLNGFVIAKEKWETLADAIIRLLVKCPKCNIDSYGPSIIIRWESKNSTEKMNIIDSLNEVFMNIY